MAADAGSRLILAWRASSPEGGGGADDHGRGDRDIWLITAMKYHISDTYFEGDRADAMRRGGSIFAGIEAMACRR